MNRREAILSALGIFAVALVARVYFAAQIVFPKPEDTAYYVAVARNLLNGRGLVFDALWSYGTPPLEVPRAAFEVWLPLPTFLDRDPDGHRRSDVRGGPGLVDPHRGARPGPGLVAGGRRRAGAGAAGRAGTDPGGWSRPHDGRLSPAAAPFVTARFHDAVHGARAGRVPADDAHPPRGRSRPDPQPTPPRARRGHRPCGADPQRGDLAGRRVGGPRLVHRRPSDGRSRAPDRCRGRGGGDRVRAVGPAQLAGVRESVAEPDRDERAVDHRPRHLRVERSADAPALPRVGVAGPARDARRGLPPQPAQRAAPARDSRSRSSASSRSRWSGRAARSARSPGTASSPSCSPASSSRCRRRGARSCTPRGRSTCGSSSARCCCSTR